jgi:hypothetical protein
VLLAQFMFPIFGLALGEMFGAVARGPIFERIALWLLLLILPAQLLSGWLAGQMDATPLIFFFSIYKHRLYFPTIVAALLILISFALWGRSRWTRIAIACLIPIALVQLVASGSVNALAAAVIGLAGFVAFHWRDRQYRWQLASILVVALLSGAGYSLLRDANNLANQGHAKSSAESTPTQSPARPGQYDATWSIAAATTQARAEQWRFFSGEIIAAPSAFLLGHQTRPNRSLHPNAQNYWLDAMYSFGALAILPLVALLAMTARLAFTRRRELCSDPVLLGTAMAAGYLVLVESMFHVGLRVPYPGIIAFFILGLLIARLKDVANLTARNDDS